MYDKGIHLTIIEVMKRIITYLVIAFLLPWTIWITLNILGLYGTPVYMALVAITMFSPLFATFITHLMFKEKIIYVSWRPLLKGKRRQYAIAWLMPTALTISGCVIFFLIFPSSFTIATLNSITQRPVAYILLIILTAIGASFINMFFALGEEAGWRGFLYPVLKERIGKRKAVILIGIIWGLWHTPVNMMGYNYGTSYPFYPLTGILAMCISCIALSAWCAFLMETTGSIWAPSLFHGAINAIAAIGLVFLKDSTMQVFGPTLTGIIPAIASLLLLIPFTRKERRGSD